MSTEELKKLSIEEQAKQTPKHMVVGGVCVMIIGIISALVTINLIPNISCIEGESVFSLIMTILIILSLIGYGYWLAFITHDDAQVEIIEAAKQELAKREQKKEEDNKKQEAIKATIENYVKDIGAYNKAIIISNRIDIKSYILIFASEKKMLLNGSIINFKDIVSYDVQDYPSVKKGEITAVSSQDNGEVVGRAILGGLLFGSAGAIIGGVTASSNAKFNHGDDETIHNFHAIINMNSFESPTIDVAIGSDPSIANEVKAIFNLILLNK